MPIQDIEYHRAYREANRERLREQRKEYNQRPYVKEKQAEHQRNWRKANRQKALHNAIKGKCKFFEIPFDLEISDIVIPETCPVLGIPLTWSDHKTNSTPSVDRIIPDMGYVKGNICVISERANRLKNNATQEELEAIVKYIKKGLQFSEIHV